MVILRKMENSKNNIRSIDQVIKTPTKISYTKIKKQSEYLKALIK